jgi:hypothetical protein
MIARHILDATIAAREVFEEEKTISNAMTWAYNVSRLVLVRKDSTFNTDLTEEVESEITSYIRYTPKKEV